MPLLYYIGWLCSICAPTYCICNGYAHYKQGDSNGLTKNRIVKRLFKFYVSYSIAVLVVTLVGVLMHSSIIPSTPWKFISNLLILSWSYTGIWWYAFIYVVYVLLSPLFYKMLNKWNYKTRIIPLLLIQFIIVETINRYINIDSPVLRYIYQHIYYLLGARLLCYFWGMIIAKECIIGRLKKKFEKCANISYNLTLIFVLLASSIVMCLINRGILLIIFSIPVFVIFNMLSVADKLK